MEYSGRGVGPVRGTNKLMTREEAIAEIQRMGGKLITSDQGYEGEQMRVGLVLSQRVRFNDYQFPEPFFVVREATFEEYLANIPEEHKATEIRGHQKNPGVRFWELSTD